MKRWWNLNNQYKVRDEILLQMGFKSYSAYLRSPLWASIRQQVFDQQGLLCLGCLNRPATTVHHRAYDRATMEGKNIDSLTPACKSCHFKGERPFRKQQNTLDRQEFANAMTHHQIKIPTPKLTNFEKFVLGKKSKKAPKRERDSSGLSIAQKQAILASGGQLPEPVKTKKQQRLAKVSKKKRERKQRTIQQMKTVRQFVVQGQQAFDPTPRLVKRSLTGTV